MRPCFGQIMVYVAKTARKFCSAIQRSRLILRSLATAFICTLVFVGSFHHRFSESVSASADASTSGYEVAARQWELKVLLRSNTLYLGGYLLQLNLRGRCCWCCCCIKGDIYICLFSDVSDLADFCVRCTEFCCVWCVFLCRTSGSHL